MILLDANVLVALVDERDKLHSRAKRDLRKLKGPFALTSVVLSEACFLFAGVWTYDSELTKVWRLPDGGRVPLATSGKPR